MSQSFSFEIAHTQKAPLAANIQVSFQNCKCYHGTATTVTVTPKTILVNKSKQKLCVSGDSIILSGSTLTGGCGGTREVPTMSLF